MSNRDRTVVLVLAVAAVIGGFWFMAFRPRHADIKKIEDQVASAQQVRDTAVQGVAAARAAQRGYSRDRAIVAQLGKAVPTDDDSASLIYQLDTAAGAYHVNFHSLQFGGGSGASGSSAPAAANQSATAALPPGAVVGSAGLSKLPFSVTFSGNYFGLESFLRRMHAFTTVHGQTISVRGRLMAVDGIVLTPSAAGFPDIQATLTASAFLAPAAPSAPSPSASTTPGQQPATGGSAPAPTASAVITGVGR